jgi:flagellar hook-basal body complex protein FliE
MDISRIGTDAIKINQNVFQKKEPQNTSFTDVLQGYLNDVNQTAKQSEDLSTKLATGEIDNIHDVTIAAQKAKLALDLTVTIRDKAVEAYQEMMRMQI